MYGFTTDKQLVGIDELELNDMLHAREHLFNWLCNEFTSTDLYNTLESACYKYTDLYDVFDEAMWNLSGERYRAFYDDAAVVSLFLIKAIEYKPDVCYLKDEGDDEEVAFFTFVTSIYDQIHKHYEQYSRKGWVDYWRNHGVNC